MKLDNFQPFIGQHCESTTTGTLLRRLDINLSEPMLFGLGEGLSYIFWNMKIMEFPFIGGRVKPDALTENICRNLNLNLQVTETSSKKKAWNLVTQNIDQGHAVGLKLDCYHLEYFPSKIHFAGHYVAMYGYDDNKAHLVDTRAAGGMVQTSLESLAAARSEKGPMSSKNLTYIISKKGKLTPLDDAIRQAIKNNTKAYLNPPIRNISYKGIQKTSKEIKKWFATGKDRKRDFQTTSHLMEGGGTGGAIFRNFYRDFLKESFEQLQIDALWEAHQDFKKIAPMWTQVAQLFFDAGATEDIIHINQASDILIEIAQLEKQAMERLLAV